MTWLVDGCENKFTITDRTVSLVAYTTRFPLFEKMNKEEEKSELHDSKKDNNYSHKDIV